MKTKTNRRTLTKLLTLGFLGIAGAGLFNAPSASALPLTDLPSVGDWSNSIFNPSIPHIDYNTTDGEAVDSNLGAIVLEILDEEGKAVPGAVFEIDGVRALRTMKSYVYNKDFGMYSQFTTDGNGRIAIENVPYGTYTVRFVSSPDGQAVTEPVKANEVDEQTTAAVQYQHPQLHFEVDDKDNDLTNIIFVSPTGATYLDLFSIDNPTNGGGREVAWDETAGGYVTPEGVLLKKDNDTFELDIGREVIELKKITDNLFSADIKAAGFRAMGGEFSVQENSDGTISAIVGDQTYVLSQGSSGCYPLDEDGDHGSDKNICKENGIYLLNFNLGEGWPADVRAFLPMRYDEQSGKYIFNDTIITVELVEGDDGRALLFEGYAVQQDPDLHIWTLFNMGVQIVLSNESVTDEIQATLASFKATAPIPSDPAQPANPQTSDTLTKAACVILITAASVFVITRKLSRR